MRWIVGWLSRLPPRTRFSVFSTSTILLGVVGILPNAGWWLAFDLPAVAVLGAVSLAAGAAGGVRERQLREVASDAGAEASANLAEGIEPVLAALEQVAVATTAAGRAAAQNLVLKAVTSALAAVVGPEKCRSCFFDLMTGPTGKEELRPRPGTWQGRGEPPTTVFRATTPEGDAALAMVRSGGYRFVDNVDTAPPPGWQAGTRRYKTFISVSVNVGGTSFGMLSVDALSPGDLSEASDLPTVRAMAKILGIALT